jgi:hypothetical protein
METGRGTVSCTRWQQWFLAILDDISGATYKISSMMVSVGSGFTAIEYALIAALTRLRRFDSRFCDFRRASD